MQHADNLLKCFSTSLSILLSVAASVVLFSFHVRLAPSLSRASPQPFVNRDLTGLDPLPRPQVTPGICLGAILVLGATFAYTSPSAAAAWRWRPVTAIGTR